jgi:hypothetical protein
MSLAPKMGTQNAVFSTDVMVLPLGGYDSLRFFGPMEVDWARRKKRIIAGNTPTLSCIYEEY